jgi:hypothetical protein
MTCEHHAVRVHQRPGVLLSERKVRCGQARTFGPTDTPVLSRRGKVLTVVQCMLSLVVVIVLVAWAVDTL